jgi:hypothetical protein
MWFKVHRNVNDIRKQIIAFIKKHIIILFTHKLIHNSDRKGIKYRMSYPRWSTSLVVNKQFWSDQSAVDQNETSKRNQLPHDPTTNPRIRSNGLWSHHLNPDTDIRIPLVSLSPGLRYKSRSMSTSWCWILYIITSLLILLRCSKVCHSSDVNMLVTHPCVLLV